MEPGHPTPAGFTTAAPAGLGALPVGHRRGHGHGAACLLDLRPRGRRDRVRADRQGHGQFAVAQDLHRAPLPHQSALPQDLRGHLVAGFERLAQRPDVHHGPFDPVDVGEPLELRHPALQGHLAALEPELLVVAGLVALRPPAGGLALAGGLAPALPAAIPRGALRRAEVVQLHPSTSSTVTRWATARTIPRISGRSSFTTVSLMRCSPRARMVAFCGLGRSITDRTWVIFSLGTLGLLQPGFGSLRGHSRLGLGDGLEHGPGGDVLDVAAPQAGDLGRLLERTEPRHDRVDDVDGVPGAEGLRKDVLDTGGLDHSPNGAPGDDARARGGRLQQDPSRAILAGDLVGDGRAHHRDLEHGPLGFLHALLDGRGDLLGLPIADADPAGLVSHHHERGEAEPPAALDHLGHAVDGDHALLVRGAFGLRVVTPLAQIWSPPSLAPSARAFTRPWYRRPPRSNTAPSTPAARARSASCCPTFLARADFSSPAARLRSEAAATVRAEPSSTNWA